MFSVKNTFIFEIIYKSLFQSILFFFLFLPEIAYWGVVWIYKLTKCNKVKTLSREVKLVSHLCMCYATCHFVFITCEITTRVFPKISFFFSFNDQMRPQRVNIVEGQNMNFSSTYGIYKQETGIILSLTKLSSNKESKYITTGTVYLNKWIASSNIWI